MRAEEAELRRLARVKGTNRSPAPNLGPQLVSFFKYSVQKRQAKFGQIGECWQQLVPQMLADHTALESFSRGTLTVLVDSSSHLYELRTLLLSGLQQQLLLACKSAGLRKIALKPGRWYSGEDPRDRRISFDD
jgi:hypothetical protein